MGATSVTGVGAGSALGLNKGNPNMSLGVARLIGPHLVAAGTVELAAASGQATITTLPSVMSGGNYVVVTDCVSSGVFAETQGFLTFQSGTCLLGVSGPLSGVTVAYMVANTGNA